MAPATTACAAFVLNRPDCAIPAQRAVTCMTTACALCETPQHLSCDADAQAGFCAPAFAAAFCAGTPAMDRPVLPARADFCFRGAQAGAVLSVFEVADLHARVVRGNLAMALFYNATTLVLCFSAMMTPVLCAVLMPISSAALVLHTSARFQRKRRAS